MSSQTVEHALSVLREYSCMQQKTPTSEAEKQQLREALLLITSLSESENLGICADNTTVGFTVLLSYLTALGYQANFDIASISTSKDPVYIKFNAQKMSHFVDAYKGEYRGVLVSCQAEDEAIAGTYGHLPLDLFIDNFEF